MKKLLPVVSIIVFCLIILGLAYVLQNQSHEIVHSNNIDLGVAQYSERNITENAKVSDPRFKNISFVEPKTNNIFQSQLASVWEVWRKLFNLNSNKPKKLSQEEYGVWVWTPTLDITPEYMVDLLDRLENEHVSVVYLSIDSYLDIYVMPEVAEKTEKEEKFNNILDNFITLARGRGIAVDAEAGWKNWADDEHTYKPYAVVNFVKDYNAVHLLGFRGFQYDVEPYLLDNYKASDDGKREELIKFTKLVDQTAEYLAGSDLKFSVVVPDFYDKKDKMTPEFVYAGRRDSVFRHLLNVLDKMSESSIIIMSYRNFADGRDGSIDVSKNEMNTIKKGDFNTEIILAVETGDVPPSYITFYNTSKNYFKDETSKLRSAFLSNPNFGGLAVHYANAFMSLR